MSCLLPPSCSFCKHYLGEDDSTPRECQAFYEIPDAIITGTIDHSQPYPGDNGIVFELNEILKEDFEEVAMLRKELDSFESQGSASGLNC